MRLSIKIAIYMLGVIAFAVVLLTYLTNAKFRSVQEEVERSRFLVLALDVKATAERGLALGLGLDQMINLGSVLSRLKQDYPEILALQIIDDRGVTLYAAGTPLEGEISATAIERLGTTGEGGQRQALDATGTAASGVMVPLANAFGQTTGALVLQYDRAASEAAAGAVTLEQVRTGALALLLSALAALVLTALYLRGVTRRFAHMTRWMEQGERPALVAEGRAAEELERRVVAVRQQLDEVERLTARAESALRCR